MRTVKEAATEIKQIDPNTAMTEWHIRQLALQGILPRVQAGKKLLINLDTLFLNKKSTCSAAASAQVNCGVKDDLSSPR